MEGITELKGQDCPVCHTKNLTLTESEREVPYFGKVFLFSMTCSSCKYHKADIEASENKEPSRYSVDIESEQDLTIRVVKSSAATVKIPHVTTITPGPASNGYVTNVEGILNRVKHEVESLRDSADEEEDRKKAKNLLKKLQRVLWGQEKLKIIIEDPTGNSAIISDKAVKEKFKVK
jgi:zinc finger protein